MKPHTLTVPEVLEGLNSNWHIVASACGDGLSKRLEFQVDDRMAVIWRVQSIVTGEPPYITWCRNLSEAVCEYNRLRG